MNENEKLDWWDKLKARTKAAKSTALAAGNVAKEGEVTASPDAAKADDPMLILAERIAALEARIDAMETAAKSMIIPPSTDSAAITAAATEAAVIAAKEVASATATATFAASLDEAKNILSQIQAFAPRGAIGDISGGGRIDERVAKSDDKMSDGERAGRNFSRITNKQ